MKVHRNLLLLLILPALGGCTRAIDIRLSFADGRPALAFFTKGLFPRRLETICLWSAEIIDEASGKVALKVLPSEDRSCARVSSVALNRHDPQLKDYSPNGGLVRGRLYHAEVSADEGLGISQPWTQP